MKSHQKLKYFKKAKSFEESSRSPIKRKAKKTISEPRKYAFKDFSSFRIKSMKKSVKSRISFRAQKHSVDLVKKIRNGFKNMHKQECASFSRARRAITSCCPCSVIAHLETEIRNSISLVDNEDDILAEHDYPRRSNWRKLSQQAQGGFRI